MKINAIQCPICDAIVFSRCRHDYRGCSCGEVAVDGGFEYLKVCFVHAKPKNVEIELEVTKNELFRDWNRSEDKFGLLRSADGGDV